MEAKFNSILKIEGNPPSQRLVYEKRLSRINEAISWSTGTFSNKDYHGIWENLEYRVALGKPGKEAAPEESKYKGVLNSNDMRPDIFKNNQNINIAATFGDVILELERVSDRERYCVELLGTLFYRSAFLLDHKLVQIGDYQVYRYRPSVEVVKYISSKIPSIHELPPEVFLQYLDAIALNEDVKYHTKGKKLSRERTGGSNNYLTYAHLIAVITGDVPVSDIAKKLLRTDVAAIGINKGKEVLPHLK